VLPDGLKRTRATKPQPGLTRKQRKTNVKNAFAVPAHALPLLKNKNVLLIDDVMTTSATIGECAKTLLKAGAASVKVLTLARKAG
jgi:predicted amidophosphoribosyltransferase